MHASIRYLKGAVGASNDTSVEYSTAANSGSPKLRAFQACHAEFATVSYSHAKRG
jgi:hypothetical protein